MFATKIRAIYVMAILLLSVLGMIIMIVLFRKQNSFARKFTSKAILSLSGVGLDIVGTPDKSADMFVLNHQSMLDIMALEVASGKEIDLAWIAKIELFQLPIFGLSLSLTEMISIDRESKREVLRLLRDVRDRLSKGRKIAIFPEGTRNVTDRFLKFKKGAEIIANTNNLRVQPVVLVNSARRFNIREFTATGGDITIVFLDSFQAKKGDEWLERVREEMQAVYNKYKECE